MGLSICFSAPPTVAQTRCNARAQKSNKSTTPRRPRVPASGSSQVVVILMRHGQTDWNIAGRVQGGLDKSRLTDTGLQQARQAGKWLRYVNVDKVFCSPLTRARDTLRLAVDASGNHLLQSKRPEVLGTLAEIQVPWQGLHKKDLSKSLFATAYTEYTRNPTRFSYNGFSPLQDVARRAKEVWRTIRRVNGTCHLIVSHNQMNKALICAALRLPTVLSAWRQENCCFNVVVLEDGERPRLRLCNGVDTGNVRTTGQRIPVRNGCMRMCLHHQGDWKGLRQELQNSDISHLYLIGDTPGDWVSQLGVDGLEAKCSRISALSKSKGGMYRSALAMLNHLRTKHAGEFFVLSTEDSETLRTIFAASIGLGPRGANRLISDVGGVSVMDVRVRDPIGSAVTYVESYNTGAWLSAGPLQKYTQLFDP